MSLYTIRKCLTNRDGVMDFTGCFVQADMI